jgi:tetratricopeptide (TPR) repeat protein
MDKFLHDFSQISFFEKIPIIFLILLAFLAIPCDPAIPSDNYFNRIAMVSEGRITRFDKLPITVYVNTGNIYSKKYMTELEYAMKKWQDSSGGLIEFQLVDSPDGANIMVLWVAKLETEEQDHPLGVAELQRTDGGDFHVEMRICHRDKNGIPLNDEQIKTVLCHEFGHAIGLWGHSKNKEDIMYYTSDKVEPSGRDIETLKMLYSHPANYSLHEESIKELKGELESKPDDARLHFLLGTVYADQDIYKEAIENFKKCLELNPKYYKASGALATVYRSSGQHQEALIEYLSLARSEPSSMVYNILGALYFEKEEIDKSIQFFRKALDMDRTYKPAKDNLYKVYRKIAQDSMVAGIYPEAFDALNEAIKIFPDDPELYDMLGIAYAQMEQFEEAIKQYTTALQINPAFTPAKQNMAMSYNNQGVGYSKAGQWEKAIQAYNQAMILAPDMEEAQKNLYAAYWNSALELSKAGRDADAINAYQHLIKLDPNNKDAHNNLGAVYFRLGKYNEAIASFTNALKLDPGSKDLRDNIAIVHNKAGTELAKGKAYIRAIEEFREGLTISPDNINLHLSLAHVYQVLDRYNDAIKQTDKALALNPDDEAVRKTMINLTMKQGYKHYKAKDYEKSLEYYSKASDNLVFQDDKSHQNLITIDKSFAHLLSKDKLSQQAKDNMARIRLRLAASYVKRGELADAKSVLKSALDLNPQHVEIKRLLADGCEDLALEFKKNRDWKDIREVEVWANQLKSR